MERLALLLGNPKANLASQDVQGALNDIDYWENFLTSEMGGLWVKGNEIRRLEIQTKGDLVRLFAKLASNKKQYLMFVFSGHGFSDAMEDYIYINPDEYISVNQLKRLMTDAAETGLMFIDACRDVNLTGRNALSHQIQLKPLVYYPCEAYSPETADKFRKKIENQWWTKYVKRLSTIGDDPFVIIQSCEKGKSSVDVYEKNADKFYGAFTRMMLDVGIYAEKELGTYAVYYEANENMSKQLDWTDCGEYVQSAEYYPKPPEIFFPFTLGKKSIDEIMKSCTING